MSVRAQYVPAYPLLETRNTAGDAIAYGRCGDRESLTAAVAALASEPERRLDLAARGYERAKELTWDASAVRLLAAYAQLKKPG